MIKTYSFITDNITFDFDDSRTIRELIDHAFNQFDYYEPAGMEIVTLFQCHHSKTSTGWFTTDTSRKCADEIENADELCFAYYMPGVFYFAEGGWGHHMIELGNHPIISHAVDIKIRFDDFRNTVVINGEYCFNDIVSYLKKTEYIPEDSSRLLVHLIGTSDGSYEIPFSDAVMYIPLSDFQNKIEEYTDKCFPDHGFIYHVEIEIC